MNLTVVVPPPFEPVTLAEVWNYLRLDPTGSPLSHPDDAALLRMIKASRIQCEQLAGRTFVQTTLRVTSNFPTTWATGVTTPTVLAEEIRLLAPPIIAVLSVNYYDSANSLTSAGTSDYYITDDQIPLLRFSSAPSLFARPDAVVVDYVAGYAPEASPASTQAEYAANVPENIKDAILIGVQLLYDEIAPERRKALEMTQRNLLGTDIVYSV